jgi:hypothetical protein
MSPSKLQTSFSELNTSLSELGASFAELWTSLIDDAGELLKWAPCMTKKAEVHGIILANGESTKHERKRFPALFLPLLLNTGNPVPEPVVTKKGRKPGSWVHRI